MGKPIQTLPTPSPVSPALPLSLRHQENIDKFTAQDRIEGDEFQGPREGKGPPLTLSHPLCPRDDRDYQQSENCCPDITYVNNFGYTKFRKVHGDEKSEIHGTVKVKIDKLVHGRQTKGRALSSPQPTAPDCRSTQTILENV